MPPGPLSIALVDFRSVISGPVSEASCRDAIELVSELARTVIVPTPSLPVHDLRVRMYGGFRFRDGQPTPETRAAPDNRRSRAIRERLGFSQEGVLGEVERIANLPPLSPAEP